MAKITPGNRLYLYQLLSRELGVGKQTLLPQAEQVLLDDDIYPSDLECATVRELMEALDDFVRVTVFKRGRVYVTVRARADWDEMLAQTDAKPAEKKKSQGGPRSWKQKRSAKNPRPAKPRPHGRAKAPDVSASAPVPQGASADAPTNVEGRTGEVLPTEGVVLIGDPAGTRDQGAPAPSTPVTDGSGGGDSCERAPLERDVEQTQDEIAGADVMAASPDASLGQTADVPEGTNRIEPSGDVGNGGRGDGVPRAADGPASQPKRESGLQDEVPSQEAKAVVSEPAALDTREEVPPADVWQPPLAPLPIPSQERAFPQDFASEVLCGNEQLAALYAILPFDVDPVVLLDEDWRVARSTQTFTREDGRVTFPLRYVRRGDQGPVKVRMRRNALGKGLGKRWVLEAVVVGEKVGFEGLPAEDEGAWSHLSDAWRTPHEAMSPRRAFAQFVRLRSWESLLVELATLAEPEYWGEGLVDLREYLAVTFCRVRHEEKLATSNDGLRAAFDTGLLTQEGEPLFMHLVACEGDIPWAFDGFSCDGRGLDPQPVAYVAAYDDLAVAAPADVRLSRPLAKAYGASLDVAIEVALRRAQRNHRVATPAYDPHANELRLLLPLRLTAGPRATNVLVLAPLGGGTYVATAVLSLGIARVCARVVSAELPSWLWWRVAEDELSV